MLKIAAHFLFWFLLSLILYYVYITSMAEALGIPGRAWASSDYLEGAAISLVASAILSLVSLSVSYLMSGKK